MQAFEQNKFVIAYYDTFEGIGNHSLVYDIDEAEISLFDSFDAMSAEDFERQRQAEGICRQVITVDVNDYIASWAKWLSCKKAHLMMGSDCLV